MKLTFSAIFLTYPTYFGGMILDNYDALIKAHTITNVWFYAVGVVNQAFKPFFPGPDSFFSISEVQFYVRKDC